MKPLRMICGCGLKDHQFELADCSDFDDKFATLEVCIVPDRPLLKRIGTAIRYVFGITCRFGMFGEVLLYPYMVFQIRDWCNNWLLEHYGERVD